MKPLLVFGCSHLISIHREVPVRNLYAVITKERIASLKQKQF